MAQWSKGPTPDFSLGYAWSQGCETEPYIWLCAGHWTCLRLSLSLLLPLPLPCSLSRKKKKKRRVNCWYDASSHPNTWVYFQQTRTIPYKPKHSHHPWDMNVNKVLSQNPQTLPKVLHRLRIRCCVELFPLFGLLRSRPILHTLTFMNSTILKITNQLFYRLSLNWILSDD